MHRREWAAVSGIAALISIMALCLRIMSQPDDNMDLPPSERFRWSNPAGYGLLPETEEYNGLLY